MNRKRLRTFSLTSNILIFAKVPRATEEVYVNVYQVSMHLRAGGNYWSCNTMPDFDRTRQSMLTICTICITFTREINHTNNMQMTLKMTLVFCQSCNLAPTEKLRNYRNILLVFVILQFFWFISRHPRPVFKGQHEYHYGGQFSFRSSWMKQIAKRKTSTVETCQWLFERNFWK